MSLLFWRKTHDTDIVGSTPSQAVSEDMPLPVRLYPGDEEEAQAVEVTKETLAVYVPIGYEAITVAATAIGLDSTKYSGADRALLTLETGQIRFRYDGAANPTSTTGHILDIGVSLTLDGANTMQQFMAIRTGVTSGTLTVTYERRVQ